MHHEWSVEACGSSLFQTRFIHDTLNQIWQTISQNICQMSFIDICFLHSTTCAVRTCSAATVKKKKAVNVSQQAEVSQVEEKTSEQSDVEDEFLCREIKVYFPLQLSFPVVLQLDSGGHTTGQTCSMSGFFVNESSATFSTWRADPFRTRTAHGVWEKTRHNWANDQFGLVRRSEIALKLRVQQLHCAGGWTYCISQQDVHIFP